MTTYQGGTQSYVSEYFFLDLLQIKHSYNFYSLCFMCASESHFDISKVAKWLHWLNRLCWSHPRTGITIFRFVRRTSFRLESGFFPWKQLLSELIFRSCNDRWWWWQVAVTLIFVYSVVLLHVLFVLSTHLNFFWGNRKWLKSVV